MPPEASVAAAPVAPVIDPKIPAPGAAPDPALEAGQPGAGAPAADNPFEYELEVKGQKQKINFQDKARLTAVLQKALYADQVIKDASQAKKGAEALMAKLKEPGGLKEVLSDPAIGADYKKFALDVVREMMEDEKLSPEQKELRDLKSYKQQKEDEATRAKADAAEQAKREETTKLAQQARTEIIGAMQKFPDIPQTQATMDAVIQNMRAGFRRFGKHLTAEQAMTVYSQQYWTSWLGTFSKMTDDQIVSRFGDKNGQAVINRIQKLKLDELRKKMQPGGKTPAGGSPEPVKKKKNMTEREFDKHFQELAGGL